MPLSSATLLALKDAAAQIYYKKDDFELFMRGAIKHPELLSQVDWRDTKKRTAATLVNGLAANPDAYADSLTTLLCEVCQFDDFTDLERRTPELAQDARAAVERLRTQVARDPAAGELLGRRTSRTEPVLPEAAYVQIIGRLKSMGLYIERNPSVFATLDEEAIRNHFLLSLNGDFKGQATGETINGEGKTDILVRVEDRNIFIAECKIWTGSVAFDKAIDQLLSYLTWRDCKCALLVFNRNQNSLAVAAKMHERITQRKEHRRTVSYDPDEGGRYILTKDGDGDREVVLSSFLFDVPMGG